MPKLRSTLVAMVVLAASAVPMTAEAARPKCYGQRATKVGTSGKDRINGTNGADVIVSKGGGDIINARGGNDLVCAGGGNDEVDLGPGNDQTNLGGGSDFALGGSGNDALQGAAGFDFVDPQSGLDRYDGGTGSDGVGYLFNGAPVNVNLATGSALTNDGDDTLVSVEGVEGTRFDDTLTGGANGEFFAGGGGNDVIETGGNSGDTESPASVEEGRFDFVLPDHALDVYDTPATAGNDIVRGGHGFTVVSFEESPGPVNVGLHLGEATGSGTDELDTVQAVIGSRFDDTIRGTGAPEAFEGYGGTDEIDGGDGRDVAVFFDGVNVNVNLDDETASGSTSIFTPNGPQTVAFSYTLESIEDVWGSFGSPDNITGSAGQNRLYGLGANDTISALASDDTVDGGAGNDTADGGTGTDICRSVETPTNCEASARRVPGATAPITFEWANQLFLRMRLLH